MVLMRALILAAGYATRLYPLTEHQPKPLLKVGSKTIIEHILSKLEEIKEIKEVCIVTNDLFYPHFTALEKDLKTPLKIEIINDGTKSNEDRLGAIGDLHFVIERKMIKDDLLVIAGDNLFGFALTELVQFFREKNSSVVAFHDLKDKEKVKGRYGVGILEGSRIIDFEEKPSEPKSALASTACYLFKKQDLSRIATLAKTEQADAPGNLIKYLAKNSEVHGFVFNQHWFDIGSFESLEEAKKEYER